MSKDSPNFTWSGDGLQFMATVSPSLVSQSLSEIDAAVGSCGYKTKQNRTVKLKSYAVTSLTGYQATPSPPTFRGNREHAGVLNG